MKRATLTPLMKGRQIIGSEREQLAARLRDRYTQGASIRDLVAQPGRSYGWTHRMLRESGVVLRGRGGAHPPRHTGPTQPAKPGTHNGDTNPGPGTPVTGRAAPASPHSPNDRNGD